MIDISKFTDKEILDIHKNLLSDISEAKESIKDVEEIIKIKNEVISDLDKKIHVIKNKIAWAEQQVKNEEMRNTPAWKKWKKDNFVDGVYKPSVYKYIDL